MNVDQRFYNLFLANDRSYGIYDHLNKSASTPRGKYSLDDIKNHLMGKISIGLVPIMDDNCCWFGAIDLDNHNHNDAVDLVGLEQKINELGLPLIVCRSRRGSAHCFVFGSEPIPAGVMKSALGKWANQLKNFGQVGYEIFPKQDKLIIDSSGVRQLGSWINIPYFGGDGTDRYAIEGTRKLDLLHFIELAESRRVDTKTIIEKSEENYGDAPPCIQKMMSNGVSSGLRNDALFNFCVFAKKAYPETWKDKCFDFNARSMDKPLDHSEAKHVINSVAKKDYRYKCGEEPCKSLCNSSVCVTKKFGITSGEKYEMDNTNNIEYVSLSKYDMDPPRWQLFISSGESIVLTTEELMSSKIVSLRLFEKTNKIVPKMKDDMWAKVISFLSEKLTIIKSPTEVSPSGMLVEKLKEWLLKTDPTTNPEDIKSRDDLLRGMPVAIKLPLREGRFFVFRANDFNNHLIRHEKFIEIKGGINIWVELKKAGVEYYKDLKVNNRPMNVWFVPIDFVPEFMDKISPIDLKEEF